MREDVQNSFIPRLRSVRDPQTRHPDTLPRGPQAWTLLLLLRPPVRRLLTLVERLQSLLLAVVVPLVLGLVADVVSGGGEGGVQEEVTVGDHRVGVRKVVAGRVYLFPNLHGDDDRRGVEIECPRSGD